MGDGDAVGGVDLRAAGSSAFLWAFAFEAGWATALTDETLARQLAAAGHGWVWMHLPLSDQRARSFLERLAGPPAAAREIILAAEPRVQLQFASGWAFGVLPDLQRDLEGQPQESGRLQFALGPRLLITARRRPLRCVDDLRRRVAAGLVPESPVEAWSELVEIFVDAAEARLQQVSDAVDRIEDRLLLDDEDLDQASLGPLRRGLSRQRRDYLFLRSALSRAGGLKASAAGAALAERLPGLTHAVEDLDRDSANLQERARLVHEEIDTRIAAGANRSVRALTVLSTLLIPPTLVAGAFGMNLGGIPFAQDPAGFVKAGLVCLAVVAAAYALLRRWRIVS